MTNFDVLFASGTPCSKGKGRYAATIFVNCHSLRYALDSSVD